MATASKLKNQKMHRTNIKKHRKQLKKEKANRKEKKQQQVAQQAEQKIMDRIAEQPLITEIHLPPPELSAKPISPARRAFQDI